MINVASNFCKVQKSLEYLLNLINTNSSRSYQKPATGIPASDLALSVLKDLNKVIETTYNELKSLRDNSQLIPGCWYRITDYESVTNQPDTRSAGHQFDILVLATSTNTLSEEARAIQHEGDYEGVYVDDGEHFVYTGRKVTIHFEGATKELYLWQMEGYDLYMGYYSELSLEELKQLTQEELNGTLWSFISAGDFTIISENEIDANRIDYMPEEWSGSFIAYSFDSYFSKSNLNAWKIWYCLDNDKKYYWTNKFYALKISYLIYGGGTETQIYVRYSIRDTNTTFVWVNVDNSSNKDFDEVFYSSYSTYLPIITDILTPEIGSIVYREGSSSECEVVDLEEIGIVDGKGVIYRMIDEYNNDLPYDFKNIQFKRYKITASEKSLSLVGSYASGKSSWSLDGITIDTDTFYWAYTFSVNDLVEDDIFDVSTFLNKYGSSYNEWYPISNNKIYECGEGYNYLELILSDNVFITDINSGDYFNGYYLNIIENRCTKNTFGNGCCNNKIGFNSKGMIFGNNCYDNIIDDGDSTILGRGCYKNTITSYRNIFEEYCDFNIVQGNGGILAKEIRYVNIGRSCYDIEIKKSYSNNITIEPGVSYIVLDNTQTTSWSSRCKNIHILPGISGSNNSPVTITIPVVNLNYTIFVGKNTNGDIVITNPLDSALS